MTCESCERADALIADRSDDEHEAYHLCRACHERLHELALRPLEWYNLAKRHGPMRALLHDDFYDEDGRADQPHTKVKAPRKFPAPKLAEVAHDPRLLFDYSVTRWTFDTVLAETWKKIPADKILPVLADRLVSTVNLWVRERIFDVCAAALGPAAADLIRYCWNEYPENIELGPLAKATAAALPHREGFDRVASAVESFAMLPGGKDLPMHALEHFRSPEALDWIERHLPEAEMILPSWGSLAARSRPDWKRMAHWLELGRPFSLVALDVLSTLAYPPPAGSAPRSVRLEKPPSPQALQQALSEYALRDPVPRVQQRVAWILQHQHLLC